MVPDMKSEEARKLANILLEHHRYLRTDLTLTADTIAPKHMLPYGELCARAELEHLTRTVGYFLAQVAGWCWERQLPPLNSLAVNAVTKEPGGGYDEAVGCSLANWWDEVRACVACEKYPRQI
jgi:hypothetical protein